MKILKVIVDELPLNVNQCDFGNTVWGKVIKHIEKADVYCRFRYTPIWLTPLELTSARCPDCPLRLEHDNARIAKEVM